MSLTSATKDTSLEDHMSGFVKKMETGQKKDHHVKVTLMIIENILKFHQRSLQRKVSRKFWNYTDQTRPKIKIISLLKYIYGLKEITLVRNHHWINLCDFITPGPEFEHSEILLNKTEYWELLKGWLGPVSTLPAKWKLCYRATDHGWSSSTFHSRCNSLGPTVTFIRVGEYMFGAYTDRNWRK